jgi:hypothetical protein
MASKLPNEILRLIADKSFTYNEAKKFLDEPRGFRPARSYRDEAKELEIFNNLPHRNAFGQVPMVPASDNILKQYHNDNLNELKRRRDLTYQNLFKAIHGRGNYSTNPLEYDTPPSTPRMGKKGKLKKRKSKK